jgi:hypothetical protein
MTSLAGLLVALSMTAGAREAAACPEELFRITRSLNANVVVYEVGKRPDGSVDPEQPVRASWILLARKGEREDLNFLEKLLAYGFEVKSAAPQPGWWVTLKAKKDRPLHVMERDGCLGAFGTIGGREGALRKLYVKADDKKLIPSVEYVELFGVDPRTGAALYEKIMPEPARDEPDRPEWKGG